LTDKAKKIMSGLYVGDNWETFLAQRERMPSWKLPLNIAVVLHFLVFAGAAFMPDIGKKPDIDEIIMIDLLSLPSAALGTKAVQPQGKKKVVASQTTEPAPTKAAPQLTPEPVESTPEPAEEVIVPPVPEIAPQPKIQKVPEVRPQSIAQVKPISLRPLKRKKQLADDVRLAEVKEQEQRKKEQEQARLAAAEKTRLAEQQAREQAAEKERKLIARKKKQQKAAARKRQAEKQADQQRRSQEVAEAARLARQAEQAAEQARLEAARVRNEYASVSQAVADLSTPLAFAGTGFSSGDSGGGSYGGSGNAQINPAAINQYSASLHGRISNHWQIPEILKKKPHLKAVVALTVRRDGSIKDMRIEQKSGNSVFDQSVLKALRSSAPLPGFPALIDKSTLEFALNFTPDGLGYL
jgi:colicin import membrane protein